MISFESDYIAGAHPRVLERLVETNFEALSGYGNDIYCKNAVDKIKKACECEDANIYFLAGGTQTNSVVISTMLKDYEGATGVKTGYTSKAGRCLVFGAMRENMELIGETVAVAQINNDGKEMGRTAEAALG